MPSNGIVERWHRTVLDEHFRAKERRIWFQTIEEMQVVPDAYLIEYNTKEPAQRPGMNGRMPLQAFRDGIRKHSRKEVRAADLNQPHDPAAGRALSGDNHRCTS